MTREEKDAWKKRKDAEDAGFEVEPFSGVAVHSQNTPKHEFVKAMLAYVLDSKGREWDTETQCDTGRVDVYDAGPVGGQPVVYEVETGVTPERARQKAEQYAIGPVRDVLVVDPADVPDDPVEAVDYLESKVVVG